MSMRYASLSIQPQRRLGTGNTLHIGGNHAGKTCFGRLGGWEKGDGGKGRGQRHRGQKVTSQEVMR